MAKIDALFLTKMVKKAYNYIPFGVARTCICIVHMREYPAPKAQTIIGHLTLGNMKQRLGVLLFPVPQMITR